MSGNLHLNALLCDVLQNQCTDQKHGIRAERHNITVLNFSI